MFKKIYQRKISILKAAAYFVCLLLILYLLPPFRYAAHYDYLSQEEILPSLVAQVTQNISLQQLNSCNYEDLIAGNKNAYVPHNKEEIWRRAEISTGGEYWPEDCRSRFSTAIIVPFRNRETQLHLFLTYMHNYLRQQRIHYRIFVVEQADDGPFNRAKLFNVGAVIAAQFGFPCLVLTDVDLLPMDSGHLYACSKLPRHMCSAVDIFRFNLPYRDIFGGVVAISTEQFQFINGLSNLYQGWGGEDDDFFERLKAREIDICRFAPEFSSYTMLKHKPEQRNENRMELLRNAPNRFTTDGLNSLEYEEVERRAHSLFTHIIVRI